MDLPNRVMPDGTLFSSGLRGTFMGNRGGRFHDDQQKLGARRWATRQWICCELHFRGRQRAVWGPGYTELFFCDEVSALAAGHRPCFECRRADATAFMRAVQRGLAMPLALRAPELDARLHQERLDGKAKRLHALPDHLPDGAMVAAGGAFFAVRRGEFLRWSFSGYERGLSQRPEAARLLTPPTIIAALAAGYAPRWHSSAS